MKIFDKVLIIAIIIITIILIKELGVVFLYLFKAGIILIIISIIFYEKTISFKDRLNPSINKYVTYCHMILTPAYSIINKAIKPINIGSNISLSTASFIIIIFLLFMLLTL